MLGEYKSSKQVNIKLETEFYKFSRQKPSFGHFLSIFRMLSNEIPTSIFNSKFDKNKVYEKTALLSHHFILLKDVIDEGAEENFQMHIDQIKGRTMSTNKGLLDLFDIIIIIRNIFAHPEDKAGKKDQKRKWPSTDEYFKQINGFGPETVLYRIDIHQHIIGKEYSGEFGFEVKVKHVNCKIYEVEVVETFKEI
jgi:hypothetical protein